MELKPCQCGGDSAYGVDVVCIAEVYCKKCGLRTSLHDTREIAAAVWNHRPIEDQLRAELEAARAELAAERARLDYAIKGLSYWRNGEKLMLAMGNDPELFGHEIPAGQTARDVIDRLRQEGGDANPA